MLKDFLQAEAEAAMFPPVGARLPVPGTQAS